MMKKRLRSDLLKNMSSLQGLIRVLGQIDLGSRNVFLDL